MFVRVLVKLVRILRMQMGFEIRWSVEEAAPPDETGTAYGRDGVDSAAN